MTTSAFRQAFYAPRTGENAVILVTIQHPLLDEPLRLSTDTSMQRLSNDPLVYGTLSMLISATVSVPGVFNLTEPAEFPFVLMDVIPPEDREGGVTATDIVFENVSGDMLTEARKLKTPARVDMAVVLASTPDYVDWAWTNLRTIKVSATDAAITLGISREDEMRRSWPYDRMTRNNNPGLSR